MDRGDAVSLAVGDAAGVGVAVATAGPVGEAVPAAGVADGPAGPGVTELHARSAALSRTIHLGTSSTLPPTTSGRG